MPVSPTSGWSCIKCGRNWGDGENISSHGICIRCLAELINKKRFEKGLEECFGKFKLNNEDCNSCSAKKYCIEYLEEFDVSL